MSREDVKFGLGISAWVICGFIIVAILTTGALVLKPTWLGMERKAYKQSHQYVEARTQEILTLVTEYDSAVAQLSQYQAAQDNKQGDYREVINSLELQKESLATRIRNAAERTPPDQIPPSARRFMR